MAHHAIQEALDGPNVVWMEHVTDDVYRRGPSTSCPGQRPVSIETRTAGAAIGAR
jgi:hypothetical protein